MLEFHVPGIRCGHCAGSVTRACHSVDKKAQVEVDLGSKRVRVLAGADAADFARALSEAGYPPAVDIKARS